MHQESRNDEDRAYHDEFAAIQAADLEAASRSLGECLFHTTLPPHTQRLLCGDPAEIARYETPEAAEEALIDQLVQARCTLGQIGWLLSLYPAAGGFAWDHVCTPDMASALLAYYVSTAQVRITRGTALTNRLATYLRAWAAAIPRIRLMDHITDASVLEAHVETAIAARSITYAASHAALAEQAHECPATVSYTNHRLVARGLLEVVDPAQGAKFALYRLLAPMPGMTSVGPRSGVEETRRSARDLFGPCGLGDLAGVSYRALLERPRSRESLVQCTRLTFAALDRGLSPLAALGSHASGQLEALAYEREGVWYARYADLEQVAEVLFHGRWAAQP